MPLINWVWLTGFIDTVLNLSPPFRWATMTIASLGKFLFHDPSHSFTDIFAGILLLGQVYRPIPKTKKEAPSDQRSWQKEYMSGKPESIRNVNRFVDYAMAMYNWPIYMIFAPILRPLTVFWTFFYLRPFNIFNYSIFRREVIGDGILYLRTAAFMASTPKGTRMKMLKYSNFTNGIFQTPMCVVVDDVSQSIVVTVRGSISLDDWLTDFNVLVKKYPKELEDIEFKTFPLKGTQDQGSYALLDLGNNKKIMVHPGMYLCAKSMIGDVQTQLITLLSETDSYEKYRIVVTGHSLGAGVASLLTLMLRKDWGDRVRGYCFSPPGCMIADDGLEEARKCILSFVVGDDIVPRACIHSAKDLRDDNRFIMDRTTPNGHSLFRKVKWPTIFRFFFELFTWPIFGPMNGILNIPEEIYMKLCRYFFGVDIAAEFDITGPSRVPADDKMDLDDAMVRLYTPGQLIHLTTNDATAQVLAKWINTDDLQEIVVSWHTVPDHLPKRVRRIVKRHKHFVYYLPIINTIPLVRRIVALFY